MDNSAFSVSQPFTDSSLVNSSNSNDSLMYLILGAVVLYFVSSNGSMDLSSLLSGEVGKLVSVGLVFYLANQDIGMGVVAGFLLVLYWKNDIMPSTAQPKQKQKKPKTATNVVPKKAQAVAHPSVHAAVKEIASSNQPNVVRVATGTHPMGVLENDGNSLTFSAF